LSRAKAAHVAMASDCVSVNAEKKPFTVIIEGESKAL
jgi:hypothetical protein